jgi:hypothetical protein
MKTEYTKMYGLGLMEKDLNVISQHGSDEKKNSTDKLIS